MRGPAQIQAAQALALDADGRPRCRMCVAVIGYAVWRDANGGVGFVDLIMHRAVGVVVVAGAVGERPGIGRVVTCRGVRRTAQAQSG